MEKKRDLSLDYAKGILIILMVMGHTFLPQLIKNFIFYFHMPCFLFISGMLLSENLIDNPINGIKNKLKAYYVPYILWIILFILIHNLLSVLHVFNGQYEFNEYIPSILNSAFFEIPPLAVKNGFGILWFMGVLTISSLVSIFILNFLRRFSLNEKVLLPLIVLALCVISYFWSNVECAKPELLKPCAILGTTFFISGYYVKRYKLFDLHLSRWLWVLYLLPIILSYKTFMSMNTAKGIYIFVYFIAAIAGSVSTISVARILSKWKIEYLSQIGKSTVFIYFLHFFVYKILTLAFIVTSSMSINLLAIIPYPKTLPSFVWIFYTIIGVTVPILIKSGIDKIKVLLKSKFY